MCILTLRLLKRHDSLKKYCEKTTIILYFFSSVFFSFLFFSVFFLSFSFLYFLSSSLLLLFFNCIYYCSFLIIISSFIFIIITIVFHHYNHHHNRYTTCSITIMSIITIITILLCRLFPRFEPSRSTGVWRHSPVSTHRREKIPVNLEWFKSRIRSADS